MNSTFRVAVVDDELLSRTLLTKILGESFEVLQFASGEAFLDEQPAVDVVLLDIEMADLNGLEVCRRLRMQESSQHLPVLFVSGHDQLEDRLAAFEAGGDDFIVKPIVAYEVRNKVSALAEQQKRSRQMSGESQMAREMAFSTMSAMSYQGVILEFMRGASGATDYSQLSVLLVATLRGWDLQGGIQIRGACGQHDFSTEPEQPPLHASVMETMRNMGRIFQMKSRGIINFPHISILIQNLPVDDEERTGQLRDSLAMLCEVADARIAGIDASVRAERTRSGVNTTLGELHTLFADLSRRMRENQARVSLHMRDLVEDVFRNLQGMNLTAVQEGMIQDVMEDGTQNLLHLFDEAEELEAGFAKVLEHLEALSE